MARELKVGICGRMFPPAADAIATIPRVEALGWDFINYPDQLSGTHPTGMLQPPVVAHDPGAPGGMYSDIWFGSFEMCSVAAALTENIEIMLAVVDPLRRSPALMAQEMATLHHLSKGRVTFALGSGEAKQFEPYGETRVKPIGRLEESIRTFKALWESGGQPISRASEFWPLNNAVFPIPQYEGRNPELLMVGGSEKLLRLAGELCEGWLTFMPGGTMDDLGVLADLITAVKSAAAAVGKDPDQMRFVAQVFASIAETDDRAWELARKPPVGWLGVIGAAIAGSEAWKKWGHEHPFGDFNWAKDMDITKVTAEQAAQLVANVPDEILNHTCVWGSPERVAARLQTYVDAGINEISLFNFAAAAEPDHSADWNNLGSEIRQRLGISPLRLGIDSAVEDHSAMRA
jgi:phthiodiolone/phenolphthiodiolone dimycocerosates ketoreductase